jgi:hypothetical protein
VKLVLIVVALMVASSAYAGILVRPIPALDEFGLIALALVVGVAGARALQRFRGRRKTRE